ncbi:MAG: hypothetical protein E7565_08845 [Ruminococcaceae bacterium]|nr:hypothetical protein [Oscillospiraceae bacterium]
MKRIFAFLLVLIFAFSLGSCKMRPLNNEIKVDFNAQYIRTGAYAEIDYYPILAVLRSKSELEDYYSANKNSFNLERRTIKENYVNQTIGFLDAVDKYDEEFFKENTLLLVAFEETSGSITHRVDNVKINSDGKFCVEIISDVPFMCDDAIENWHLIIEVSKESAPNDYDDILIYKDNKLINDKSNHTHQPIETENGEFESIGVYCGNTLTTVYFDNGKSYSFMSGNSVRVTDILRYLDYDKEKVCDCLPEYTVDTEFGIGYGINLTEGYARCDKGQADLTTTQLNELKKIIAWADEKSE